jgi:hypothetical protein
MTTPSWSSSNDQVIVALQLIPLDEHILEIEREYGIDALCLTSLFDYLHFVHLYPSMEELCLEISKYIEEKMTPCDRGDLSDMVQYVSLCVSRLRALVHQCAGQLLMPLYRRGDRIFLIPANHSLTHISEEMIFDLHQTFNR